MCCPFGSSSPLAFLRGSGFRDWRGRVLFNTAMRHFEVYLDTQLQTPQFEAEIIDCFGLPKALTVFRSDPDYVDARFILHPHGPSDRAL